MLFTLMKINTSIYYNILGEIFPYWKSKEFEIARTTGTAQQH